MATTKDTKSTKMKVDDLPNRVIGGAIEVPGIHGARLLTSMKVAAVKIRRPIHSNNAKPEDGTQ